MSLPNIYPATLSLGENFSITNFFRLSFLKKHHLLFAIELTVLGSIGLLLAVSTQASVANLLTPPKVVSTYPETLENKSEVDQPLRVTFSNPVDQSSLKPEISPPAEGSWEFRGGGLGLLGKELVFNPAITLLPETNYSVTLKGIKPIVSGTKSNYSFSFRTKELPSVVSADNQTLGPNDSFVINLDTANTNMADFGFSFSPNLEYTQQLSQDKKQYILKHAKPLKQGTNYYLTINKKPISFNLKTKQKIEKKITIYDLKTRQVLGVTDQTDAEKTLTFLVLPQPTIPSISATGTSAATGAFTVNFDKPMDKYSVANSLSINPVVGFTLSWPDNKTLLVTPNKALNFGTDYQLIFAQGAKAQDGTFLESDFKHQFTTVGNVKVNQFTPSDGSKTAAIGSKIYVSFDQPVDKTSAQSHFSISPPVSGNFSWNQNMMIFSPSANFPYSSSYTVTISKGIKSLTALDSIVDFRTSFTTAALYEVVKLAVPLVKQKYSLSCEFANMKMVLSYRGVNKSEDELIAETPFDNTPNSGGIWGDPFAGFVGNVNGTYFGDGYGAYYPVIVSEISKYRPAEAHVGWNVTDLLSEVKAGNPVIVWSCLICNKPRYWTTPASKSIYAYEFYHMMTVVGYTGTVENPQSIILNDSYSGRQISYSKSQFSSRWSTMNNTAVVVK